MRVNKNLKLYRGNRRVGGLAVGVYSCVRESGKEGGCKKSGTGGQLAVRICLGRCRPPSLRQKGSIRALERAWDAAFGDNYCVQMTAFHAPTTTTLPSRFLISSLFIPSCNTDQGVFVFGECYGGKPLTRIERERDEGLYRQSRRQDDFFETCQFNSNA